MNYYFTNNLNDDSRAIRTAVFIQEQGFNNEFDDIDEHAYHLVVTDDKPIGVGRLYLQNDKYHIGRIAVIKEYRHKDIGTFIVLKLLEKAKELNAKEVTISAQLRVKEFYLHLGFISYGDIYKDEHCDHIKMKKVVQ